MKHTKVFPEYIKHIKRFFNLVTILLSIQLIAHILFIIFQIQITISVVTLPLFFSGLIVFTTSAMIVMTIYYQKTLPRQLKKEGEDRSFQ